MIRRYEVTLEHEKTTDEEHEWRLVVGGRTAAWFQIEEDVDPAAALFHLIRVVSTDEQ